MLVSNCFPVLNLRYEWEGNSCLYPGPDEHGGTTSVRLSVADIQSVLHRQGSLPWVPSATTQPHSPEQGEEIDGDDLLLRVRGRRCRLIQRVRAQTTRWFRLTQDVCNLALNGWFWISVNLSSNWISLDFCRYCFSLGFSISWISSTSVIHIIEIHNKEFQSIDLKLDFFFCIKNFLLIINKMFLCLLLNFNIKFDFRYVFLRIDLIDTYMFKIRKMSCNCQLLEWKLKKKSHKLMLCHFYMLI